MTRLPGQLPARNGAIPGAPRGALLLSARIALLRLGWLKGATALLLAFALLAWLWALPLWHDRLDARQAAIAAARQRLAAPPAVATADAAAADNAAAAINLAQFRATLGDARGVEAHLQKIYAIARQSGIGVEQAEYRCAAAGHGQFQACQLNLPLHAGYASVRRFAEQVLRDMPFVSLDEFAVRREDVRDAQPQARLRFTLHLAPVPGQPTEVRP